MDGVPLQFLKIIMPHIIHIITHIFNTILMTSKYPKTWKISKVIPIAKVNNPSCPADYRPFSILPAISKGIEIIMRRQITEYVEQKGLLSSHQSGFRLKHSTTTALLKVSNDVIRASKEKLVSLLILLDFSKAFDSVDHSLLCSNWWININSRPVLRTSSDLTLVIELCAYGSIGIAQRCFRSPQA
jgi:hypothetical protein